MTEELRLRQICLVAPELAPAANALSAILGLEVAHRDPHVSVFGVENVLIVAGTTFLEIIAPTQPDTAAGRFLERTRDDGGGYMAIFDCPDPQRRAEHAADLGVSTAYSIDRPDYKCFQLHPRECRAAMLEFDRTEGGQELLGRYGPAGGDGWQRFVDTRRARGVLGIEVVSTEPADLARHWGSILERPVRDGYIIALDGAEIRFEAMGTGTHERLEAVVLDAADPQAIMEEARNQRLATGERRFRLAGMTFKLGWDA